MTLLIVGDNPGLLNRYTQAFSDAGHLVVPALSAAMAEQMCGVSTYDVIVITLALPEGERNRLADRVRARSPQARIVCAGRCAEAVKGRCLKGADLVIDSEKPQEVLRIVALLDERLS